MANLRLVEFARDCPRNNRKPEAQENKPAESQAGKPEKPVDMDTLEPEPPNEEDLTPEQLAIIPAVQDKHKFVNPSLLGAPLRGELVETYQACFGSPSSLLTNTDTEDESVDFSDKFPPSCEWAYSLEKDDLPQKVQSWEEEKAKVEAQVSSKAEEQPGESADLAGQVQQWVDKKDKSDIDAGVKSYCPRCRTDKHTEAQSIAAVVQQALKQKCPDSPDSKPGKTKDFVLSLTWLEW